MEKTALIGRLAKDILLSGLLTAPVGAGLLGLRYFLEPPKVLEFPETKVKLPMLPRKEKKEEIVEPELQEKKAVTIGHLLGGVGGLWAGHAGMQYVLDRIRAKKLDQALAQNQQALNQLLLDEQEIATGGIPKQSAELGGIFEKDIGQLLKQVGFGEVSESNPLGLIAGLTGVGGFGYGLAHGYRRAAASDPARALAKKLKETLAERLGEARVDEKGQRVRGPMVIKLENERTGTKPLKPGAVALVDPSAGRDVLSML